MTRTTRGTKRHYVNNFALYDVPSQRREFIENIRAYGKPSQRLNIFGQGERCGFNPPCHQPAVELWIWGSYRVELCQIEIDALQKDEK